ncbi:MAG: CoA ester lyase [Thermomicrobiales bacterium]|nr:CoA ester lyase [Thermomicrobiales bacterium]
MTIPLPRSLLFVPGHRQEMLAKATERGADAVVLDLEDSVPLAKKEEARRHVAAALADWPTGSPVQRFVRINAPRFGCVEDDLRAVTDHADVTLVVPKVDRVIELEPVRRLAVGRDLVVNIETPRSLLHAEAFADAIGVTGLFLGGEDLSASIGMRRTPDGAELQAARWMLLLAARAAGIAAWDSICPEFRDTAPLQRECEMAAAMGFDGKFAIHPAQIPTIHVAFAPSSDEVDKARRIVEAYDAAVHEGHGAVSVDGAMVDPPVAERARALLARASRQSA